MAKAKTKNIGWICCTRGTHNWKDSKPCQNPRCTRLPCENCGWGEADVDYAKEYARQLQGTTEENGRKKSCVVM